MRRSALGSFVTSLRRCVVAMEACCGAHHLGRVFAAQGHEVRLMSPEYVRPYVKAQKNDDLDAEAIAEAASRPTMRFVEVKSQAQSDIQALHRARERLVSERTALINHLRALLLERGIVTPQGRRKLEEQFSTFADDDGIEALSPRIKAADRRSACPRRAYCGLDKEFVQMAREPVRRLVTILGIGTINATALDLVKQKTPLSRWARELLARGHKNVVVVALANKLARIAWVVLARGGVYNAGYEAVAA